MRMFRREKYPEGSEISQGAGYLGEEKSNAPFASQNTENGLMPPAESPAAENAVQLGGLNMQSGINAPTGRIRSGAARVLIAARTIFPDAPDDETALNLLMDLFDDKIRSVGTVDRATASVMQAGVAGNNTALLSLRRDEEKLKKIIPGFSIAKAFENEEFKKLVLEQGMDLFAAYEKLNPAYTEGGLGVIDEVGSSAYAATPGSSASDIASASEEEFNKYIKGILEEE